MERFDIEKVKGYTIVPNYHQRDLTITLKAKGLLSQMFSLPEGWDYTLKGLAHINMEGIDAVRSGIRELEKAGYVVRTRTRDEQGRLRGSNYKVYATPHLPKSDSPTLENPTLDYPIQANSTQGMPTQENPTQLNIDRTSKEESKKVILTNHSIPSDEFRPSVLTALDTKRKEAEHRDIEKYRNLIMDNIEYEILLENNPYDREMLEEILELLVDTVCATKKYIRVAGSDYPAEVVRSRLLKLNAHHIEFVISCFKENTTKVRNVKQYLLTSLYNAPVTIDSYYTALVHHDLYGTPRE